MKKILSLFVAVAVAASTFAGSNAVIAPSAKPAKPAPVYAADVFIPIGKNGEKVSLLDLSTMKVKELEKLTGQKMKLADKAGFKVAQKQLRDNINADGTFNNKKISKLAAKKAPDGSGFHLGGFALGFLLGLIGVLIAYLIPGENKRNRTKWAWLGLLAWLVILLIVIVI